MIIELNSTKKDITCSRFRLIVPNLKDGTPIPGLPKHLHFQCESEAKEVEQKIKPLIDSYEGNLRSRRDASARMQGHTEALLAFTKSKISAIDHCKDVIGEKAVCLRDIRMSLEEILKEESN